MPGTGVSHQAGFGKDKRIRSSVDFEALLRSGTRRTIHGFTFFFRASPAGSARLGIVITRKHAAHAVDRNRIKRCIREAFRQTQQELGAMDVLVRPPYGVKMSTGTVGQLRASLQKLSK